MSLKCRGDEEEYNSNPYINYRLSVLKLLHF